VWKVIGSDSHPTQGEFSFTSSGGQACPDAEEEDPKEEPKETRDDQSSTSSSTSNGSTSDPETTADSGGNRSTNRAGGGSTRDEVRASENRVVDRTNRNDPIDDVAAPDPTPTADKSIWDGLPLGDFLVALAVAALIGAAGGRIYAGIIGPK
jgi:hypothetical protein